MKLGRIQKKYVAVIILLTALISSFITYSFAGSISNTLTLSAGIYPGSPSYTIYPYDETYFAKDQNGIVEFSDTDASSVISDILDALPTTGGTINLKIDPAFPASTYTGDVSLDEKFVTINAEMGSVWEGDISIDNFYVSINGLQIIGDIDVNSYEFRMTTGALTGDLTLISDVSSVYQVFFDEVNFINCNITVASGFGNFVNDVYFTDCYFEEAPVTLTADFPSSGNAHRVFESCYFYSTSDVPLTWNYGTMDKVTNCHFDCAGIYGIEVNSDITSVAVVSCSFNGLGIDDNTGGGWKLTLSNIQGIPVKHVGLGYDLTDGDDIAHGLGFEPTFVGVSCITPIIDDAVNPMLAYWNQTGTDDTTFKINIFYANGTRYNGSSAQIYWLAEYVP